MTHVHLLTRFNVVWKSGQRKPSDDWMENRLSVFELTCLPSVKAQTWTGLTWWIFVHRATHPSHIERLRRLSQSGRIFRIAKVDGLFTAATVVECCLSGTLAIGDPLVTMRLDNDDALSSDAVEAVARQARGSEAKEPFVINLGSGFRYKSGSLYRRVDPSSPFCAMVERVEPGTAPLTIFVDEHQRLVDEYRSCQVLDHPYWVQFVHGENVSNENVGVAVKNRTYAGFESVSIPLRREPTLEFMFRWLSSTVKLACRVATNPEKRLWFVRIAREYGARAARTVLAKWR